MIETQDSINEKNDRSLILREDDESYLASLQGDSHRPCLIDLPDDIFFVICRYCDISTLGRLARVCRRFSVTCSKNYVWRQKLKLISSVSFQKSDISDTSYIRISDKEKFRLAKRWRKADGQEIRVKSFVKKVMPWMQYNGKMLWVSYLSHLQCLLPGNKTLETLTTHKDISRFKIYRDSAVIAHSDGSMTVTSLSVPNISYVYPQCHNADIHDLDYSGDIVVTGSKDRTVKVWRFPQRQVIKYSSRPQAMFCDPRDTETACQLAIDISDRVWSVAINPDKRSILVGSAAIHQSHPLNIFDIERSCKLYTLGSEYRHGAGVLGIQYESTTTVLTCGYDTSLRLWDLRQPPHQCAAEWLDTYDSTLYCVKSDGMYSMFTGTANNGIVRWWDKRMTVCVQQYYMGRTFGKRSTPVYSLAFDSTRLFAAVDLGVCYKDFAAR